MNLILSYCQIVTLRDFTFTSKSVTTNTISYANNDPLWRRNNKDLAKRQQEKLVLKEQGFDLDLAFH